jgi:hypothetical protein
MNAEVIMIASVALSAIAALLSLLALLRIGSVAKALATRPAAGADDARAEQRQQDLLRQLNFLDQQCESMARQLEKIDNKTSELTWAVRDSKPAPAPARPAPGQPAASAPAPAAPSAAPIEKTSVFAPPPLVTPAPAMQRPAMFDPPPAPAAPPQAPPPQAAATPAPPSPVSMARHAMPAPMLPADVSGATPPAPAATAAEATPEPVPALNIAARQDALVAAYRAKIAERTKAAIREWLAQQNSITLEAAEDGSLMPSDSGLIAAIPMGDGHAILVPTAGFVVDFATRFAGSQISMRQVMRNSFDAVADNSGDMKLQAAGVARLEGHRWVLVQPGRLGGFTDG